MFTHATEKALLNAVYHGDNYTAPGSLYVALFTSAPSQAGTGGTEVSGGSYARKAVTFSAASGGGPASTSNNAQVQFPTASADWGTVVSAAIFSAATGGAMLDVGALASSKKIESGDTLIFPVSSISITLD